MVVLTGSTQAGAPTLLATVEAASGTVRQITTIGPGPSYASVAALADGDALVTLSDPDEPSTSLLHVVSGRVVSRAPGVGDLLITSPAGGGWSARLYGNALWSVGADGRVRGSIGHLRQITDLAADSTGSVYVTTETSIVVAAFQPR
jgi:hypothetical protein